MRPIYRVGPLSWSKGCVGWIMPSQRRSGRIAKELPIVLLGSDATGKVFAEQTNTVVLSRHGAGVVSRHRFAPDEVLTLRLQGPAREAEVRLVGQIGGEPGRYVYGLAFADPALEFWPIDFPPPESFELGTRRVALECTFCQARQTFEQDDIEEDVYSVNENVLRFCDQCGSSTPWKKARSGAMDGAAAPSLRAKAPSSTGFTPPPPVAVPALGVRATANVPSVSAATTSACSDDFEPALVAAPGASAYSAAALDTVPTGADDFSVVCAAPEAPASNGGDPRGTQSAAAARPVDANGRRVNRRKHMRVGVDFRACVRQGEWEDDIVECKNVSKGGLCFHSKRHYAVDSTIKVAAPYSPGEFALFLPAKVRRCERLGDGDVFRYGVAYLPRNSQ